MTVGRLRRAAGILRRTHSLLLTWRSVGVAGGHQRRSDRLLRCGKNLQRSESFVVKRSVLSWLRCRSKLKAKNTPYMISAAAASSTCTAASAVAVLAGAPLCRGSVRILVLSGHRCDSIEHLGCNVPR